MLSPNTTAARFLFVLACVAALLAVQSAGPTVPPVQAVTQICISGALAVTDPMFGPGGRASTLSCTCAGQPQTNYDEYTITLTGCTGATGSITAMTCPSTESGACAGAVSPTIDTIIYIYPSTFNGTTPCSPCYLVADADACVIADIGSSRDTASALSNGTYKVVVTSFSAGAFGNYSLTINVAGASCSITHVSNNPTAITLNEFTVKRYDRGSLIEWQTGSEKDNLGFNVYREEKGKRVKINPQIIAGSALLTGPGTNLAAGGSYSWWDDSPQGKRAAQYYLEEIKLSGEIASHGPLVPDDLVDHGAPPDKNGSLLLTNLNAKSSSAKPVEQHATTASATVTSDQANAFASRAAVKLSVKQEGWYRASRQDLVAAGLDSQTDPRNLQLFVDGIEQAILVQSEQAGKFDAVEFYAVGLNIPSTDTRTYWLVAGSTAGKRISQAKAKAKRDPDSSFPYTVERRDQTLFVPSLKTDKYFGAIIAKNPTDQSLDLRHVDQTSAEAAKIDIALQGLTQVPHRVKLLLNDELLGEMVFQGQAQSKTTFSVPHTWLKQGANKITLIPEAGDTDVSVVEAIGLTYQHTYSADGDALRFTASKKQSVTIDGFTSSSIRVVDITDPNEPKEITGKIRQQGSGYAITTGVPKPGERSLLAFADSQIKQPVSITANEPSNWREPSNQADLLVIGHRDFLESVEPLVALRRSQGLTVAVANVEDVYDEFSFGSKTPQAIKDFLFYASTNWQKAPRFVLLVGDATNDPRDFLGKGDFDFVPTKMIATQYNQTASDSWFADFAGDGLTQMAVGRLPVRTAQEADIMVAKIVSFEQSPNTGGVLLISDITDGYDFESTTSELRGLVPSGMRVDEIRRSETEAAAARTALIESLNRGDRIVNYTGHGSVEMWRGGILTPADARSLTNRGSLPVFLSMTCLNGYFQDPSADSLAESLMKAELGGASAVWASSGFVDAWPQAVMNKAMFTLVFGGEPLTLGEMANKAKASVTDFDVRRTYTLFGDPSMKLK